MSNFAWEVYQEDWVRSWIDWVAWIDLDVYYLVPKEWSGLSIEAWFWLLTTGYPLYIAMSVFVQLWGTSNTKDQSLAVRSVFETQKWFCASRNLLVKTFRTHPVRGRWGQNGGHRRPRNRGGPASISDFFKLLTLPRHCSAAFQHFLDFSKQEASLIIRETGGFEKSKKGWEMADLLTKYRAKSRSRLMIFLNRGL